VNDGANGGGTVFKFTPSGALTVLHNFCSQTGCTDGENFFARLALGPGGEFYGTTANGGANSSDGFQNHAEWHADNAIQFLFRKRLHGQPSGDARPGR
jgi:uncharacterized repeat protein (TIGR03803 family)